MKRTRLILILGAAAILLVIVAVAYVFTRPGGESSGNENPVRNFLSGLFPFGQEPGGSKVEGPGESGAPGSGGEPVVERLRKVSDGPVTGAWFVPASSTTPLRIRFMERATGHVYETRAATYGDTRVSNTTLPGMEEFVPVSAESFIVRRVGGGGAIENTFATLIPTSSPTSLRIAPLEGFTRIAVAPDGQSAVAVLETGSGSRVETMRPDGTLSKTVLVSPIRSFVPLAANGRSLIASAPSSGVPGFVYEILEGGTLLKRAGDIPGLMAIPSPSGEYLLVGGSSGTERTLAVIEIRNGARHELPLGGLVAKCAWISESPVVVFCGISDPIGNISLPDNWLLGSVSLNDTGWLVHPLEGSAKSLGKFENVTGVAMDVMNPDASPDGEYVLFMNKNDLSLWSLRLSEE